MFSVYFVVKLFPLKILALTGHMIEGKKRFSDGKFSIGNTISHSEFILYHYTAFFLHIQLQFSVKKVEMIIFCKINA